MEIRRTNIGEIFYYHPNHLSSTMYVTDAQQSVVQSFLYAPYGDIISEYNPGFNGNVLPNYAFNAKELDEETGFYYYEARYYNPPTFTSRDPLFEKYFWMSPYAYCANNPVKYVDPTGKEWVGIDGKKVEVKQEKNGQISVGNNASNDLKRMASLINSSGSKTAVKQFMKLSENKCKIHFQIIQDNGDGDLQGYHQAHNESGYPLDWDEDQGVFVEMPSYVNNTTYKEATITIYENVVDKYKGQLNYQDKKPITIENAMVVIFAHEAEHNLNKLDILSIRHSINNNCKNPRDVERSAKRITNKTLKEIYYAK